MFAPILTLSLLLAAGLVLGLGLSIEAEQVGRSASPGHGLT